MEMGRYKFVHISFTLFCTVLLSKQSLFCNRYKSRNQIAAKSTIAVSCFEARYSVHTRQFTFLCSLIYFDQAIMFLFRKSTHKATAEDTGKVMLPDDSFVIVTEGEEPDCEDADSGGEFSKVAVSPLAGLGFLSTAAQQALAATEDTADVMLVTSQDNTSLKCHRDRLTTASDFLE